eukprot:6994421-Prymnesium_polylepis.1
MRVLRGNVVMTDHGNRACRTHTSSHKDTKGFTRTLREQFLVDRPWEGYAGLEHGSRGLQRRQTCRSALVRHAKRCVLLQTDPRARPAGLSEVAAKEPVRAL